MMGFKTNYNTQRSKVIIPDYGRNVQMLIEFIMNEIKDKEERTLAVATLVTQIAQQNPTMKNQPEYLQKIWGHLYIISGYKLDVDFPYPLIEIEADFEVLKPLQYSKDKHKYRFYGKNVELMIKKAITMEEGELKDSFINSIANYMRMAYKLWNDDRVDDEVIIGYLTELSEGKIKLEKMPEPSKIENGFQTRESRRSRFRNNNKRYYRK